MSLKKIIHLTLIIVVSITITFIIGFFLKKTYFRVENQGMTTVSGLKVTLKKNIFGDAILISNQNSQKLTGVQIIGKKEFYFSPKNYEMFHGFMKIDGQGYYFGSDGYNKSEVAYKMESMSLKSGDTRIEKVISYGLDLVGKSPYVYGGGREEKSIAKRHFDCSSFVAWLYRRSGMPLVVQSSASTTSLPQTGTDVDWEDKRRGDILVTPNIYPEERLHTAIYLGGGYILHDSASTNGVAISRLNELINFKTSKTLTWEKLFKHGVVRRED